MSYWPHTLHKAGAKQRPVAVQELGESEKQTPVVCFDAGGKYINSCRQDARCKWRRGELVGRSPLVAPATSSTSPAQDLSPVGRKTRWRHHDREHHPVAWRVLTRLELRLDDQTWTQIWDLISSPRWFDWFLCLLVPLLQSALPSTRYFLFFFRSIFFEILHPSVHNGY